MYHMMKAGKLTWLAIWVLVVKANCLAARTILPPWFEQLVKCFSYKEVQFCLPMKTSCLPAENVTRVVDGGLRPASYLVTDTQHFYNIRLSNI